MQDMALFHLGHAITHTGSIAPHAIAIYNDITRLFHDRTLVQYHLLMGLAVVI